LSKIYKFQRRTKNGRLTHKVLVSLQPIDHVVEVARKQFEMMTRMIAMMKM